MAQALSVGKTLKHKDAHALSPVGAVGAVGKGLAASVEGDAALHAESDEEARLGHDCDSSGERQRAFACAQRAAREMKRNQRGRARGVDGHRRALKAKRIRDST